MFRRRAPTEHPAHPPRDSRDKHDGAEQLWAQARWLYERDEARAYQFVARAAGVISVSAAVGTSAPVLAAQADLSDPPVLVLLLVCEIFVVSALGFGVVVIRAKPTNSVSLTSLENRWSRWQKPKGPQRPGASEMAKDLASDLMFADPTPSPLQAQKELADTRAKWFGRCFVSWVLSLVSIGVLSGLVFVVNGVNT